MKSTQHNVLSTMRGVYRVPQEYQRETDHLEGYGSFHEKLSWAVSERLNNSPNRGNRKKGNETEWCMNKMHEVLMLLGSYKNHNLHWYWKYQYEFMIFFFPKKNFLVMYTERCRKKMTTQEGWVPLESRWWPVPFCTKRNHGFLKKMAKSKYGQEMDQMSLGILHQKANRMIKINGIVLEGH